MYLDINYYSRKYTDLKHQQLVNHWYNYGIYEKRYPNNFMENLGFIILRLVRSEHHDQYWQECYKCIRQFYNNKIIIIDDNSNYNLVSNNIPLENTEIIQSEYPGRGELLPYIYYLKYNWFKTAFILHDSVFINKPIFFRSIQNFLSLWIFNNKTATNYLHISKLLKSLNNNSELIKLLYSKNWNGIFGCMTIINYNYLKKVNDRYVLSNLIPLIKNRYSRMCFERILALILHNNLNKNSIMGNIFKDDLAFKRNFNDYISYKNKKENKILVKVWSSR
jgi:hypothetical protein